MEGWSCRSQKTVNVDNIPPEYHEIEDCLRAFLSIQPYFVTDQLAVVECVRAFRNACLVKGINCLPEILKLLDMALQKTPNCDSYVPYWELRGDVLDGLERREEARECYHKALEMKKAEIRQYHKSIEEGQQSLLHKYGAFGKRIDRRRAVEKLGDMWADVARFLWKIGEHAQARRIMSDSTKVPHPKLYAFHKELGL